MKLIAKKTIIYQGYEIIMEVFELKLSEWSATILYRIRYTVAGYERDEDVDITQLQRMLDRQLDRARTYVERLVGKKGLESIALEWLNKQ